MSIVNEVRARVRCEVYPCKNRAVAAIGPENRRQICFNVCEDHLRQIVEDGAALLTELAESPGAETGTTEAVYVVNYLNKETGEALADSKTGMRKIGDTVAETPVEIEGYAPELMASYPTLAEGPNIINFYYVAKKGGGGDPEDADGAGGEPKGEKTDTALLSDETENDGQTLGDGEEIHQKEPTDPQNEQTGDVGTMVELEKPVFTCKHCGEKFEKKTDLMIHAKVCPNRPPKES